MAKISIGVNSFLAINKMPDNHKLSRLHHSVESYLSQEYIYVVILMRSYTSFPHISPFDALFSVAS